MSRIYAIGDVHGQFHRLRAAHERIDRDRETTGDGAAPVVHLGDLVDRGPDSRQVIEFVMEGVAAGRPWIVLKGNHDRFFHRCLGAGGDGRGGRADGLNWLDPILGGAETLASYGVTRRLMERTDAVLDRARDLVPEAHVAFMESLPVYHRQDDLLFVHAGIRPGLPLEEQSEDDLLWIRDPFLWHTDPHPWIVVHGHTPVDAPAHYGNRINLDTGAGYGGPVTAAVFEDGAVSILEEAGRRPLRAPR